MGVRTVYGAYQALFSMQKIFLGMRDCGDISLQTISTNWSVKIANVISSEKSGQTCLCWAASVLALFKNRYINAWNSLNHVIIERILSKKQDSPAVGMLPW